MATITASMVAELRAKTDAPMMECKKALTEADGDMADVESHERGHRTPPFTAGRPAAAPAADTRVRMPRAGPRAPSRRGRR